MKGPGGSSDLIQDQGGIFPVHGGNGLVQLYACGLIGPMGKKSLAKAVHIGKALGMNGLGIEVASQFVILFIEDNSFIQLGEQAHPAGRRAGGRHQQAMIAPGIGPANGGTGPASQAIGLQPFALAGLIQVLGDVMVKVKAHKLNLTWIQGLES